MTTQTQSSVDEEDDEPEQTQEGRDAPDDSPEGTRPARYAPPPKKRKVGLESALIRFMDTPMPTTAVAEVNPDRAFFDSLLPSISAFTEDEKLEFKTDVLNSIKRIRQARQIPATEPLHQTSPSTPILSRSLPETSTFLPSTIQQSISSTPTLLPPHMSQLYTPRIPRSIPTTSTFIPQTFHDLQARPQSTPSIMAQPFPRHYTPQSSPSPSSQQSDLFYDEGDLNIYQQGPRSA